MTDDAITTFSAHADEYEAARRRLVPTFDDFYDSAVSALRLCGEPILRVLDLGAGTGLLAARVAAAYPQARLTLLDGAGPMLERARSRFGDRADYLCQDFAEPLPPGPWDAIVSALAIHHLDDAGKQALFTGVHGALRPGGVFVNAEQVLGPDPAFTACYLAWHERSARRLGSDEAEWQGAVDRMRHDRCATVEAQLRWLRDAGFQADCLYKHHMLAVLVARRIA